MLGHGQDIDCHQALLTVNYPQIYMCSITNIEYSYITFLATCLILFGMG